jgi:hypothetical protein
VSDDDPGSVVFECAVRWADWRALASLAQKANVNVEGRETGDDVGCGVSPALRKKKSMSDIAIYRQLALITMNATPQELVHLAD